VQYLQTLCAPRSRERDQTLRSNQSELIQVLEENQQLRRTLEEKDDELDTMTEMQRELLEALETLHTEQVHWYAARWNVS
jgi:hypothetical protein